jgi:hypothetical protein
MAQLPRTPVDEILNGAELSVNVAAGRDSLEFLDARPDLGLINEGLCGFDHLDPPGVPDEAVNDGDPVQPFSATGNV